MADENNVSTGNDNNHLSEEFLTLLNRSQELFNGVRNMPRYGVQHWQEQFLKTFEVFTKLWKFQQDNRHILEKSLDLQRHQIGDIASKIGQLYYHYYLHTSDAKYLYESLNFYSAIHRRSYYVMHDGAISTREVCVKYLRYLARYYVVALLTKDVKLMEEIVQDLERQTLSLSSKDESVKKDWLLVLKESKTFSQLDNFLVIHDEVSNSVIVHHRLPLTMVNASTNKAKYKLQNALIIGASEKQTKFSELTVDMHYMIQMLEYEPDLKNSSNSEPPEHQNLNPRKHLLYKPSFAQTYAFLAAIYKDLLLTTSVLLIYMSGDGESSDDNTRTGEFYSDGVEMTSTKEKSLAKKVKNTTNPFCLYPEDLIPFTRRPLFVIVDSARSNSFASIPNVFNQPFICLMSPAKLPDNLKCQKFGSIFTLFLLEPLLGICKICNLARVPKYLWAKTKVIIEKIAAQTIELLLQDTKNETAVFESLLEDVFLHAIMSKYVITWMVLRLYKKSLGPTSLPSCIPKIKHEVLENKALYRQLLDVFSQLNIRDSFYELTDIASTFTS